jgi:branched-chain amino acid transport system substrate-binding protein
VKKGNKLVIRPNPTLAMTATALANTVMDKTPHRSYAVIHHTDDWGIGWKTVFAKMIQERGGKILAEEGIDEKTQSDFYTQLTKIIGKKPDALFVVAHDTACSLMIKQARELGFTGSFIFSEGFRERGRKSVGYDKLEGSAWAALPYDFDTPEVLKFMEEYRKHLKKEPILYYSPIAYECFMILARGMEKAGTLSDPHRIRAAIPAVIPHPESMWHPYDMGADGQAKSRTFVGIVVKGKAELLR